MSSSVPPTYVSKASECCCTVIESSIPCTSVAKTIESSSSFVSVIITNPHFPLQANHTIYFAPSSFPKSLEFTELQSCAYARATTQAHWSSSHCFDSNLFKSIPRKLLQDERAAALRNFVALFISRSQKTFACAIKHNVYAMNGEDRWMLNQVQWWPRTKPGFDTLDVGQIGRHTCLW
jgi:hypothetical protein